jgi:hypothetical protein
MAVSLKRPPLLTAQHAFMRRTGEQISQTAVQRLNDRLNQGDTPEEAADYVFSFFELHDNAMAHAKTFEPGKAAQDAYGAYCNQHGARFGYGN